MMTDGWDNGIMALFPFSSHPIYRQKPRAHKGSYPYLPPIEFLNVIPLCFSNCNSLQRMVASMTKNAEPKTAWWRDGILALSPPTQSTYPPLNFNVIPLCSALWHIAAAASMTIRNKDTASKTYLVMMDGIMALSPLTQVLQHIPWHLLSSI